MATEEIITQDENPHALIVRAPDERAAMVLMDRMDLEQAMAELRGEVIQTFVYVAKDGKKQPTYAGIKEAARLYRNVHFGATATPLADGSWMITSYAHNLADNTRCDYPMPYPSFDPRDTRQAIEFRASISKSIRNALAAVLPIAYLNTMIARWMEDRATSSQVRGAAPPSERSAPQPTRAEQAAPVASSSTRSPVSTVRASTAPPRATAASALASGPGPADAEGGRPANAAEWTQQQLAAAIRAMAGTSVQTLVHWQHMARTYGVPVPARGADMTQAWLVELYQAMQARACSERIREAPDGQALRDVTNTCLDLRNRREISTEQYAALDAQADARDAQLAADELSRVGSRQSADPGAQQQGALAAAERARELAHQIKGAASEQEIAAALAAAGRAKDAGQITQEHRVGLLRMADTRRAALSGPLTAPLS